MDNKIKISVILPAYNAEKTIGEAIQSIIEQTYKEWELLVINDGSTDGTKSVILSFDDPRIKYIENDGNKKLIYTLNRGLELATGKYIARMDADDISLPERFENQLEYMESHSECVVCGTLIQKFFGNEIIANRFGYVGTSESLKKELLIHSCFMHPTVMLRTDVLKKNNVKYDENFIHAEDYKLWIDLMDYGTFCNLPIVLLKYRMSREQITTKYDKIMHETARRCRRLYISKTESDEVIKSEVSGECITRNSLSKARGNIKLLECLYLSLQNYSISNFFYLIYSGDLFRIRFMVLLAILKRFVKGNNPVL